MNTSRRYSIALIGLSGAGKSTVARVLAARLGWFWNDIDARIVQRASRSVAEIFGIEGESYFRKLETDVLREVLLAAPHQPCVVATGGGIVLGEENRTLLRTYTYIVWLDASDATLLARLRKHGEQRPLLAGQDPQDRLARLRAERMPLYQQLADQQIATEGLEPSEVAECVFEGYTQHRMSPE